jgi:hypothetical protein
MAEIKLDYVNTFYDARGKLRHQFRRKGHKKETIKGRSGSQEFMDAYHALLDKTGGAMPVAEIGRDRPNRPLIPPSAPAPRGLNSRVCMPKLWRLLANVTPRSVVRGRIKGRRRRDFLRRFCLARRTLHPGLQCRDWRRAVMHRERQHVRYRSLIPRITSPIRLVLADAIDSAFDRPGRVCWTSLRASSRLSSRSTSPLSIRDFASLRSSLGLPPTPDMSPRCTAPVENIFIDLPTPGAIVRRPRAACGGWYRNWPACQSPPVGFEPAIRLA